MRMPRGISYDEGQKISDRDITSSDAFYRRHRETVASRWEGLQDAHKTLLFNYVARSSGEDPILARKMIDLFGKFRLLTFDRDQATRSPTIEVAHEALIREWPRLRDWLDEDRDGLRLHRHLSEAAHDWELLERDSGALYRGARLAQAREWAEANSASLNGAERAFLAASTELEQHEAAEREAQRQRELKAALALAETQQQAARRLRRRNRVIAAAGAVATLAAFIAADEFMKRLGSLPLAYQPGERWLYHMSAEILGVLIARAAWHHAAVQANGDASQPADNVETRAEDQRAPRHAGPAPARPGPTGNNIQSALETFL